jgi:hypothetical protein
MGAAPRRIRQPTTPRNERSHAGPFLPAERIDAGVLTELRALFAGHGTFALDFAEFGRFPELLWLAPVPDAPVRALTAAVEARWPGAPPYGGRFDAPGRT